MELELNKNRKKELEYFCRQYPEWDKMYGQAYYASTHPGFAAKTITPPTSMSPVETAIMVREYYLNKMQIIDDAIWEVVDESKEEESLIDRIRENVCFGVSYYDLEKKYGVISVGRQKFYKLREAFFILLNKARD